VRPIVLRDESPPDDATIVVRGGLLAADSVRAHFRTITVEERFGT
jgi:hypothetical protein